MALLIVLICIFLIRCGTAFHVLISHLYIISAEVSVNVFLPFLNQLLSSLIVGLKGSLSLRMIIFH